MSFCLAFIAFTSPTCCLSADFILNLWTPTQRQFSPFSSHHWRETWISLPFSNGITKNFKKSDPATYHTQTMLSQLSIQGPICEANNKPNDWLELKLTKELSTIGRLILCFFSSYSTIGCLTVWSSWIYCLALKLEIGSSCLRGVLVVN